VNIRRSCLWRSTELLQYAGRCRLGQTNWRSEELRGPFSVGLIEGMASRSRFVNGGGVYAYRTVAQCLSAGQFINRTRLVNISDGNLTIDQGAGGFAETRINYVLVAPATAPPAAPTRVDCEHGLHKHRGPELGGQQ
jgi:hypothetical protein